MKTNMGNTDRVIRTSIAVALIGLSLNGDITGIGSFVAYGFAAIFLLTSVVSFCPIYTLFGISTCPVKRV